MLADKDVDLPQLYVKLVFIFNLWYSIVLDHRTCYLRPGVPASLEADTRQNAKSGSFFRDSWLMWEIIPSQSKKSSIGEPRNVCYWTEQHDLTLSVLKNFVKSIKQTNKQTNKHALFINYVTYIIHVLLQKFILQRTSYFCFEIGRHYGIDKEDRIYLYCFI